MALFFFFCTNCNIEIKKLFKAESAIQQFDCPKCNSSSTVIRKPKDNHTLVYEIIDSGIQAKKVVQLANAPDLLQEREDNDKKKKLELKLE